MLLLKLLFCWCTGSVFTRNLVVLILILILQLVSSHKEEGSVPETDQKQQYLIHLLANTCAESISLSDSLINLTLLVSEFTNFWVWERKMVLCYLKKFIILTLESWSMSTDSSIAFCICCSHLSAASWVTGNGRWRPIRAGWPTQEDQWQQNKQESGRCQVILSQTQLTLVHLYYYANGYTMMHTWVSSVLSENHKGD